MEIDQSSLLGSSVLHLVAHRNWGRDKCGSVWCPSVTSSAALVDGADLCPHLLLIGPVANFSRPVREPRGGRDDLTFGCQIGISDDCISTAGRVGAGPAERNSV